MNYFRITLICLSLFYQLDFLFGQAIPSGYDYIDVNNINARINTGGDHFCNFDSDYVFEVPKGSGKHTIGAFGFWIGGVDYNDQLKFAGQLYRENGSDFYTGPLSTDGLAETNAQSVSEWDKFWRVSRAEVENHKYHFNNPGYETPDDIEDWPAHGDASINFANYIAPFNDVNNDGIYDYSDGDFPAIKGDLSLFHVFNDNAGFHSQTNGSRIGIEVQSMIYGFDCQNDSVFNNSIFSKLTIINRGNWELTDSYFGFFIDFNIGYKLDDFIGCDTILNSVYGYNGVGYDPVYGDHPPAQALCVLNDTIDGFMYFNGQLWMDDPDNTSDYYNYLKGKWRDGSDLVYGGNGHVGTGGIDTTNFAFPGNPSSLDGWSEVSAGNNPYERKGLVSFGPFTILPGMTKTVDLAFVFANDYEGTNLTSVDLLKERISQLKYYYNNDSTPCGSSWSTVEQHTSNENHFRLFPNPVNDVITIQPLTEGDVFKFDIVNLTGNRMKEGVVDDQITSINLIKLPKGFYVLRIWIDDRVENYKFVKQ